LYSISRDESEALRGYIQDKLQKGFIQPSTSPIASPAIFVKKANRGLRFCVDYRKVNAVSVKDRYPLPLIRETLNNLSLAKIYTKLDIISAFNTIRVRPEDVHKTAFRIRYGLFESLVLPFGLSNGPATFQSYINAALHPYLDVFCTAYLDDVLIYSENPADYDEHVRLVLQALRKAGLHVNVDKLEFSVTRVDYLGLVVSTSGISMDPKKVATIRK